MPYAMRLEGMDDGMVELSAKRIVVCDSGLGGLDVASRFFLDGNGEECSVIYMNAYPDKAWGYNDLQDERAQEELLRKVMMRMEQWEPDVCLIACNTLSIIWQRLRLWWRPSFTVQGIIEAAVSLMADYMRNHEDAELLILGTKSTIASNVYPMSLANAGVGAACVHSMACHRLATLIEQNPAADAVRERISQYADEAARLFDEAPKRLALAFCCTHYGYVRDCWQSEFAMRFGDVDILNPNDAMLCEGKGVAFEYHSKLELADVQRSAMAALFADKAPLIADALRCATVEPLLF